MKTLIFVTICLFSLCQAYPAGEVSTQDATPSSVPDECNPSTWKQRLQANPTQYKQQIVDAIKAHMPTNHTERWYNISSSDRQCLTGAQQYVGFLWIAGVISTEDECITKVKQTCPNASAEIDQWHSESVAHREQYSANWTEKYNSLPQSVRDVFTNLNQTFNSLRKSGAFLRQNKTEIQKAFLPVVQQFLAVSQADWDQVVAVFPYTNLTLGSSGTLNKPFFVLVQALADYLNNSTVDQTAVKQAQQAFAQYGQQMCQQNVQKWKNYVNNLPKTELSPQAQSGIDSSVNTAVAAASSS